MSGSLHLHGFLCSSEDSDLLKAIAPTAYLALPLNNRQFGSFSETPVRYPFRTTSVARTEFANGIRLGANTKAQSGHQLPRLNADTQAFGVVPKVERKRVTKGARLLVPDCEGSLFYAASCNQKFNRPHQANLPAPYSKLVPTSQR